MRRPEQDTQRAVFEHVAWRRVPGAFLFHPANGGLRSKTEAAILKSLGVVAGTPDIIGIRDGRAYGLELKAPGGRTSDSQLIAQAALRLAGAEVASATGLDQALAQLEVWGFLRGSTS